MKISGKRIKIIPFATMSYRIRMGAEVLEFQLFLGSTFHTRIFWKNRQFISYHDHPFPFLRQQNGRILNENVYCRIPAKTDYHPS